MKNRPFYLNNLTLDHKALRPLMSVFNDVAGDTILLLLLIVNKLDRKSSFGALPGISDLRNYFIR